MKRVAKFEKVSYKQFEKDYLDTFGLAGDDTSKRLRQEIESMYYGLELPTRATKFSAGFDIRTPFSFTLKPGEVIKIPTGIKCHMNTDYVLMIYPRSGLGFKYQCKYNYDIDAVCGRYVIDAKSIMGLLSLGIPKEIFIVIHTNNRDVISKFEEDISKWKVEE